MTRASSRATAAAEGDNAALAALVRSYHDQVYRYGIRVCRDGYDADDAIQEAFVKLARRPDVVRGRGALGWLLVVVRNACLRMLRPLLRERRGLGERIADIDAVLGEALDPRSALERWELVQSVHAAIAMLERPFREVVVLRDLEGLSGDETCIALGLSRAAMKTRLYRARSKLRAMLQQRGVGAAGPAEGGWDLPGESALPAGDAGSDN